MYLSMLCSIAHQIAKNHGFWDEERNDGEMLALIHSEISEALEALRHPDKADEHCPDFSNLEIEMADACIRIFDFCAGRKLRLEQAIHAKLNYNKTRPIKHGKKF